VNLRVPGRALRSVSSFAILSPPGIAGQADLANPHQRQQPAGARALGFEPDVRLWMVTRGAHLRVQAAIADPEDWSNR